MCDDCYYQPGECHVPCQIHEQFESLHQFVLHVVIYGAHVKNGLIPVQKKNLLKNFTHGFFR